MEETSSSAERVNGGARRHTRRRDTLQKLDYDQTCQDAQDNDDEGGYAEPSVALCLKAVVFRCQA